MTDTPIDRESVESLSAEDRGQRLLVAALGICATGRQTASTSLCKEAQKQLSALWAERQSLRAALDAETARADRAEAEVKRLQGCVGGWAKVCLSQSNTLCREPCPWCLSRAALKETDHG